ncbi:MULTISPECIES: recombinase-like helix-turn-helix domain-containing protein [unclassified Beijerinckia]|uniref:recombinase-like helix-turn-helix domain-containing protein n=1 Tax=unclassified Beijerinckia TaxID=2638183 RepID=UPI00089C73E0|nr:MULTISPECIES: recombinase-like helix-turn-helix domain-containing protein [unclassified Beijerinckia]MDH7794152.1 hypothetical protein [Beijerinckia sp. GAS462]SEB54482.1 hypothetical protein SAMN05443249_0417 [Beijerinckia sp. 28-YEA-48]
MPQYNADLQRPRKDRPNGSYEKYQVIDNVVQQTRSGAPGAAEMALAMGLESAFRDGVATLPALVSHLNAAALVSPAGQPWDEMSLVRFLEQNGELA